MAHVCAAIPNFLILEFHGLDVPYWEDLVTYAGGPREIGLCANIPASTWDTSVWCILRPRA
jgi:hypothetical protein